MSRPLRILHTNMLKGWGGQSNRILVEALGTRDAGHEVVLAVPEGSKLQQKGMEAGIECWRGYHFRPPAQFWTFIPDLLRFRRQIRQWRPDIIHVHGSPDTWLVAIARALSGCDFPVVVRSKHNIFEWRNNALNRWLYRHCDAFVSISSFIERQIIDFPGLAARPRALIPSVPDLDRIRQPHPSIRPELQHWREGQFLWGSTGRLRWEKGFDVLLNAFAMLRTRRQDVYLIIAGDGSDRAKLETQAAALGLGPDAMAFLGFRQDVPAILASLDGYVLASRSEGLGTAILEALAAGLPVVATNVGGIPDSVRHEETGLLVPPDDPGQLADAMERMMMDGELRERLARDARKLVEEVFAREELYKRTNEFYELIAGS